MKQIAVGTIGFADHSTLSVFYILQQVGAKRKISKQHTSTVIMGSGLRLGFKPPIHITHLLSHINTLSMYELVNYSQLLNSG